MTGEKSFSAGTEIDDFESGRNGDAARAYNDLVGNTGRAIEAMPKSTLAIIARVA
jgi:enoyl-CoA hydratase/carnithine racemase